jgi:ABC-2 type transport system permease protein
MNTQSNAMPESFESRVGTPQAIPSTRLMYWSIRREFWENRFLYIAPLSVAALALLAFSLSSFLGIWETALRLNPEQPQGPYELTAGLMMLTGILVTFFYCLDALYGERRDRSILFWKSLPVSDVTAVLAKASIPLVVLPLVIFTITFALQWMMLLVSSAVVAASGQSVATLWTRLSFFEISLLMLYHLVTAHALWPAPVYCWLLLVSGWARRAPFVWAILPVLAIGGVEMIAFHTSHFAALVGSRFIGDGPAVGMSGPNVFPTSPMAHIAPGMFLVSPGLWTGLALSAAFLAVAIRVRRYQGPI